MALEMKNKVAIHMGSASWCSQHQSRQLDCFGLHYPESGVEVKAEVKARMPEIDCQCSYPDGKWRYLDVKGKQIHLCGK